MTTHHDQDTPLYCAHPPQMTPSLRPDLNPDRVRAILVGHSKWVNGTVLRYCFLDGAGNGVQKEYLTAVDSAFEDWANVGIGLSFLRVDRPTGSEVRIGFDATDGSWSYVGRDCLSIGVDKPTMNLGWDPTSPYGRATVRHEIGHALGFAHEHQNPFAGIEWDDEKVYADLGGPPNFWPRERTYHNILRKLSPNEVTGSTWDPTSIMQYGFRPGLIRRPEEYRDNGIPSPLELSQHDQEYVRSWYPPATPDMLELEPFRSVMLDLASGEQSDYEILPPATQKYQFGTFGSADVLLVLFEEVDGELRYLTGEDDSGEDRNGRFDVKLFQGRRYVLRARMYSTWGPGKASVMYW